MSKWEMVRLGDVGKVLTGNTPKTSDENNYDSRDVCFYKPGDFDENKVKILENADSYISNYAKEKARLAPEDSVLVTCIGIIGKVGVTTAEVSFNQQINAIIPDNKICDSKYLAYAILKINKHLNDMANSAVVPIINKSQFENIQIPLPPLHVQQKIADILDRANVLIEKRKTQIEKLDLLVKSQFIEMFGDPVTNPKGWEVVAFSDISKVRQGLQIPISERHTTEGYNRYKYITVQYLNGSKMEEYIENPKQNVICQEDDVLMTRTGNTGLVITGANGVFHNNFFLIDFDRSLISKNFLVYYLNTQRIQWELLRRAGSSTIPDLNHSEFYKIGVYLPPVALQVEFTNFVGSVEAQKSELKKSLELLGLNYKSLMQKCFEGEVV